MKKFPVLSGLLALAAFAMLAGPALADFVPVGTLLFEDNFSSATTFALNNNITSPARVSGPLAGQVSYDVAGKVGLEALQDSCLQVTGTDALFSSTGRLGLTKDFNNDLALGGFTIVANIYPGTAFGGIGAGQNGSSFSYIADLLNANAETNPITQPGFYACLLNLWGVSNTDFGYGAGGAQWWSNVAYGASYTNFDQVAMVFTDAGDNNPFNGSGTITAKVYIDGTLVDTATGPDFAHNFISFQGTTEGGVAMFQDLRIYGNAAAAPEPGTLALLAAAAGIACVWFRRRR